MGTRGGTRPGAGRKSKATKLMEAAFVAEWFTNDFQEIKWKRFVNSTDERIALDSLKYLTDRIYGKAQQSVSHTGANGGPLVVATLSASDLTDDQLAEIIASHDHKG